MSNVVSDAELAITVGEKLVELAILLLGRDTVQAKLDAQFAAIDAAEDIREAQKFGTTGPEAATRPETPDALAKKGV